MTEPLIQVNSLTFFYAPERHLLSDASFALHAHERIGLIGANGSGKTTFFHLLVGLLRPKAGDIRAFGSLRRQEEDFHEVRIRAGFVFQDADDQLFCPTVLEDVAFGPLNIGNTPADAVEIARRTLASLGISGFEHRITHKLSYGEKRLVALATVLAMQPDVLLLDEPTNGLDDSAKARLLRILLALPQAMIVISHDREFLHALATRIVRLNSTGQFESI